MTGSCCPCKMLWVCPLWASGNRFGLLGELFTLKALLVLSVRFVNLYIRCLCHSCSWEVFVCSLYCRQINRIQLVFTSSHDTEGYCLTHAQGETFSNQLTKYYESFAISCSIPGGGSFARSCVPAVTPSFVALNPSICTPDHNQPAPSFKSRTIRTVISV